LQLGSIHAVLDVLPAGELEPAAGQVRHTALPVEFLYFPVTHAEQVPPFAPVKPGLQVQAVTTVLELGEVESLGHAEHADAPTATEYVPVGHLVHTVVALAPRTAEYSPASQLVQNTPPVVVLYFPVAHASQLVHDVSVMSCPAVMLAAIAVVASSLRYSSTTKAPAMFPLN
jgi:hypothetical protein